MQPVARLLYSHFFLLLGVFGSDDLLASFSLEESLSCCFPSRLTISVSFTAVLLPTFFSGFFLFSWENYFYTTNLFPLYSSKSISIVYRAIIKYWKFVIKKLFFKLHKNVSNQNLLIGCLVRMLSHCSVISHCLPSNNFKTICINNSSVTGADNNILCMLAILL